jgi:hypothetical protein
LIEMRLRVASGHVRERLRHHDIAQSAASSPFPTKKNVSCPLLSVRSRTSPCA